MVAITAKQLEALNYVDTYGTAGVYASKTLNSLLTRGLIEPYTGHQAIPGWNYQATALGILTLSRYYG